MSGEDKVNDMVCVLSSTALAFSVVIVSKNVLLLMNVDCISSLSHLTVRVALARMEQVPLSMLAVGSNSRYSESMQPSTTKVAQLLFSTFAVDSNSRYSGFVHPRLGLWSMFLRQRTPKPKRESAKNLLISFKSPLKFRMNGLFDPKVEVQKLPLSPR